MTSFGDLFKAKRLALGLTLREFCLKHNLDAVYVSKLERGRVVPPQDEVTLRELAGYLRLNSSEWQTFEQLALTAGMPENLTEPEIVKQLPLFVKTLRTSLPGKDISREVLRKLAQMIANA